MVSREFKFKFRISVYFNKEKFIMEKGFKIINLLLSGYLVFLVYGNLLGI